MGYTYKVGGIIWHGSRYWKSEGFAVGEVLGWNTKYIPYQIRQITAKRILVYHAETDTALYLNRQTMERDGKQYHTRFHEYFFKQKPPPEKESRSWSWRWRVPTFQEVFGEADCLRMLGLSQPFTVSDVRRAYKRLAKTVHPDCGGSHKDFIELKRAHDSALRLATR